MKINLTIADRLVISRLYPQKDSLKNQILVKSIQEKVQISQEDLKNYEIKEKDGLITWSKDKEETKEIELTDIESVFLKEQIENLDRNKEITPNIVDLCLKIQSKEK